jgi:hypothetical protein
MVIPFLHMSCIAMQPYVELCQSVLRISNLLQLHQLVELQKESALLAVHNMKADHVPPY